MTLVSKPSRIDRNIESKNRRPLTANERRHEERLIRHYRSEGLRPSEIAMTIAGMSRTKIVSLGRALGIIDRQTRENASRRQEFDVLAKMEQEKS